MRFLIDAQLPPQLAHWLVAAGHQAEHVFDLGLVNARDKDIWRLAVETGAAIITKDSDFAAMCMHAVSGPPIIWLRFGNTTNEILEKVFLPLLPQIVEAVKVGEGLVEIQ